jgi:hypothetical protein
MSTAPDLDDGVSCFVDELLFHAVGVPHVCPLAVRPDSDEFVAP